MPTNAGATTTRQNRHDGTTRAPYSLPLLGDRARSREPSPVQHWRTYLDFIDEGTDDEADNVHFTLKKSIDPSKYDYLFHIKPKLDTTNYTLWSCAILRALQIVSLHVYLNPNFTMPSGNTMETKDHPIRWQKANLFVCSVLTAMMMEEQQHEIGHLPTAAEIWMEARRRYMDTTAISWTFTITMLISTRYTDGEDALAHIARMRSYRRDLLLIQRDIDDELFACFLRVSMPSSWNYVFTTLPDPYTSTEVERRIRDEYGVRTLQGAGTSLQAVRSKRKPRLPMPGQPYGDNCKTSGHRIKDRYSLSGPMHGKPQEPRSKKEGTRDIST